MYIHIIYIYAYTYTPTHTHMHPSIHEYAVQLSRPHTQCSSSASSLFAKVHTYLCKYIHVCMYMSIYVYICIYTHTHIHTHTHTHPRRRSPTQQPTQAAQEVCNFPRRKLLLEISANVPLLKILKSQLTTRFPTKNDYVANFSGKSSVRVVCVSFHDEVCTSCAQISTMHIAFGNEVNILVEKCLSCQFCSRYM